MGGGNPPVGSGGHEGGGKGYLSVTALGSVLCGGKLSTEANDGFIYISTMPDAPGAPATPIAGLVPLVVDTKNSKIMAFIGGKWKGVTLA